MMGLIQILHPPINPLALHSRIIPVTEEGEDSYINGLYVSKSTTKSTGIKGFKYSTLPFIK
jgi:hypothetical protein